MKKLSLLFMSSCFFVLLLSQVSTVNALPKEIYAEWQARYDKTVDTMLKVKVVDQDGAKFCAIRSKLWIPCYCTVFYEVVAVDKKPENLALKVGDQLSLKYRCDSKKRFKGKDSTLPWMEQAEEDGVMALKFRSSYLTHKKKNRWIVENREKVFYPFAHNRID